MSLEHIRAPVAAELDAVEVSLLSEVNSDLSLIKNLSRHLLDSGGKRLRPLLVLLVAKAFKYDGPYHITLATTIEFVHTATLLHDDVVDASTLRRGKPTANDVWGNQASVLVGDFMYSRAFQMMVKMDDLAILKVIAQATNTIARGEVLQLMHAKQANTKIDQYMAIIHGKTAALFAVAAEAAAMLGKAAETQRKVITQFGLHLGTLFQLIDDILDYSADPHTLGKNIGDDLSEGKLTLPLIIAMQKGNATQQALIKHSIETADLTQLNAIQTILKDTEALHLAYRIAEQEMQSAVHCLNELPHSDYKTSLKMLAEFALARSH